MIVSANTADAKILTEIALKSKAIWNYTEEQLKNWTDDLTVSKKMIRDLIVFKFMFDDIIIGFYILNPPELKKIELEFLFVLPEFIGKGIGNQLIQHAFSYAKNLKCSEITLIADPNAVPFYESKGFKTIDKIQSSIFNRYLPVMSKEL
jgi:GNAT superfamily N-acetyltransferase